MRGIERGGRAREPERDREGVGERDEIKMGSNGCRIFIPFYNIQIFLYNIQIVKKKNIVKKIYILLQKKRMPRSPSL